jgi:hypothetical protein
VEVGAICIVFGYTLESGRHREWGRRGAADMAVR